MALTSTPLPVADRVNRFSYAIRNIVVEAKKVEAAGRKVAYLNIGDPIPFGFVTPPHLVEAIAKASATATTVQPSAGIPRPAPPGRTSPAATRRDRTECLTSCTSEGSSYAAA